MSGGLKAGLIFGVVALVLVIAVSFIPFGPILCGPLTAALLGGVAGYYGVRWSTGNAGVGTGILSGSLVGVGGLIGAIVFFMIAVGMVQSAPEFNQALQDQLSRTNPGQDISPDQIRAISGLVGPVAGFCVGLINLLFALAAGALGGYFGSRNRARPAPPTPPMAPPPMEPQG